MTGGFAPRLQMNVELWWCVAAIATTLALNAMAQPGATVSKAPDAAAAPDSGAQAPAFEVASIRPNKSGGSGSHSSFDNGRFTATNIGLRTLIQYDAFGIPGPQIVGGPGWLSSDKFDIAAKVDDATAERMKTLSHDEETLLTRRLVQQLLTDRFKLAVHMETKELPVYALVVAKGGPKLTLSKQADGGTSLSSSTGRMTAKGVTMTKLTQSLTQILARELGRIVIDETGVEGRYDLALLWTPDTGSASLTNASNESSASAGPSIFTALQEQLGLKLESTKGPVETLVIDHVEQPTEN
jgi:uncharacterized protein (TIGR03435 family)